MESGVHQCLVYSLAMLLGEDVDVLIRELGHDGMRRVFPGRVPHCYNGHHMQEIIDVCIGRNVWLTPIELFPRFASALAPENWLGIYAQQEAGERFERLAANRPGILIGQYQGRGHAVAWDGTICFDPNGKKYEMREFNPAELWIVTSHHRETSSN